MFVKIRKHHICPVRLVRALFAQVAADGLPMSRHLVRVVPLQRVFFPDEQELTAHIRALIGLPAAVVVKRMEESVSIAVNEGKGQEHEKAQTQPEGQTEEQEEVQAEERATKRSRVESEVPQQHEANVKVEDTLNAAAETAMEVSAETTSSPPITTVEDTKEEDTKEEDTKAENQGESLSQASGVVPTTTITTATAAAKMITVAPGPPLSYNLLIKIRNHDTLKKIAITQCVTSTLPRHRFHYNYKDFKVGLSITCATSSSLVSLH